MRQKLSTKPALGLIACTFFLLPFSASASFIGQNFDVTFNDPALITPVIDNITGIVPGVEISYNDTTNIGNLTNGIMLDGESIDFFDALVTFTIRGDGALIPGTPSGTTYQTTGWNPSAAYTLDNFNLAIDTVFIESTSNVLNNAAGVNFMFDANSIALNIGELGILNQPGILDVATVTLNVSFIPIPPSLVLALSGFSGLMLFARRNTTKHL